MTIYYIDPEKGLNANAGTSITTPKKDFTSFSNAFVGGNQYLVKAGTRMVSNSTTRANVISTGGSPTSWTYIGRYGEGSNPILDAGGTFFPIYIKAGNYIKVEDIDVINAAAAGIVVEANSTGINYVTINRCRVYRCGVSNLSGSDAISVQIGVDGGESKQIVISNCDVFDNRNHGIKCRQGANGVQVINCRSWNNGAGSPSHGMGCASAWVAPTTWSLVSGSVYETTGINPASVFLSAITSWEAAAVQGNTTYNHLTLSATPSTPGLGEFGIGANNTLRINIGINPTGLIVYAAPRVAKNVIFKNCEVYGTKDQNGIEGWGWQFDIFSKNCHAIGCISHDNDGGGFSFNISNTCSFRSCLTYNNKKQNIYIGFSKTSDIFNCTSIQRNPLLNNIENLQYSDVTVKNCNIYGGLTGLKTDSEANAPITEDYNNIFGATTARTNVSAGTHSIAVDPVMDEKFALKSISTLINAGTHLGYRQDILGNMLHNPPSIGCYEASAERGTR